MPVCWLMVFSSFAAGSGFKLITIGGRTFCSLDSRQEMKDKTVLSMWLVLYFFLPVVILCTLNTAIVVRLRKIQQLHKTLAVKNSTNLPRSQHSETCVDAIDSVQHRYPAVVNVSQPQAALGGPSLSQTELMCIESGAR